MNIVGSCLTTKVALESMDRGIRWIVYDRLVYFRPTGTDRHDDEVILGHYAVDLFK